MDTKKYYRYPGSKSFEDNDIDRLLFFGRNKDREELYHTICSEILVVLFAKSGVGKSSLLRAGLFEKLRKNQMVPIPIRLNDPNADMIKLIYNETKTTCESFGYKLLKTEFDTELNHFFHKAELWTFTPDIMLATPVLVFDQFEEIFTSEHQDSAKAEFFRQFAELVKQSEKTSAVKIIISIREEFLGKLDELKNQIPYILSNRIWLKPLSRSQADDAIIKPAKRDDERLISPKFDYHPKAVNAIVNFLSTKRKKEPNPTKSNEVEPFQLQIICQHIEQMVIDKYDSDKPLQGKEMIVITEDDLGGQSGMYDIMQNYYDNQLNCISIEFRDKARELIEENLIINKSRVPVAYETIISKHDISEKTIDELIDCRLLRREKRGEGYLIEISLDTLVEPILKFSEKRKKKEEEEKRRLIEEERWRKEQQKIEAERKRAEEQRLRARKFRILSSAFVIWNVLSIIIYLIIDVHFDFPTFLLVVFFSLICIPLLITIFVYLWQYPTAIEAIIGKRPVQLFRIILSIILLYIFYIVINFIFYTEVKIESDKIINEITLIKRSNFLPLLPHKYKYIFQLEKKQAKITEIFADLYLHKQLDNDQPIRIPWGNYEIKYNYAIEDTIITMRLAWNFRSFRQTLRLF